MSSGIEHKGVSKSKTMNKENQRTTTKSAESMISMNQSVTTTFTCPTPDGDLTNIGVGYYIYMVTNADNSA